MQEKKQTNFKTPNINNMQEVIIDRRTKIYIAMDANPAEARERYLARIGNKEKVVMGKKSEKTEKSVAS